MKTEISKSAVIYYGGFLSRVGGAFHHALSICQGLNGLGWSVRIVTLDDLPLWSKFLPHLIEKFTNRFQPPLGYYLKGRVIRFLYRKLIAGTEDLRIFEDIYISWNSNVPSATILHASWTDNLHSLKAEKKSIEKMRVLEARLINETTHPVITVSFPYRQYLQYEHYRGMLHRSIEVVPLGLDQSKFDLNDPPSRVPRSIVCCGGLERRKNLFFLLEVFKELSRTDQAYSLTLVGDGPQHRELSSFVQKHQLNVTFRGRLTYQQVIEELYKHEIYVHTSEKESFCFALLEAKLAGLTTLAYSALQVPLEFIDIKVPNYEVQEWVKAVESRDKSPISDFSREPYTIEAMTRGTLEVAGIVSSRQG